MKKDYIKAFGIVEVHTVLNISAYFVLTPWHWVMYPCWVTEHGPWCAQRRQRKQDSCSAAQQPGGSINLAGKRKAGEK